MVHDIEIEILDSIRGGYRLKVSVLDLGLFMYGWTIRRSDRLKSGWWVQPQAIRLPNGTYKKYVEFDKSLELWQELEEACIKQINEYRNSSNDDTYNLSDEDTSDEALLANINKIFPDLDPSK